jgi:drug/metabolite transporter (DMT)-like permease
MAGLSRTSASHSVVLMSMSPVFVLLIAAARKQERMTALKLTGMLLAIGGVGILNAMPSSGPPGSRATLWGDCLVLLSALAFAAFTVMGKTAAARHDSITANTFSYLGATVAVAPLALWEARGFSFGAVSVAAWTSILYMALFPSVVCYLIYYYALHFIPASRVAAFSYLQPLLATIMAAVALGERVTLPLVAGGAVIFSGVYLTERG